MKKLKVAIIHSFDWNETPEGRDFWNAWNKSTESTIDRGETPEGCDFWNAPSDEWCEFLNSYNNALL